MFNTISPSAFSYSYQTIFRQFLDNIFYDDISDNYYQIFNSREGTNLPLLYEQIHYGINHHGDGMETARQILITNLRLRLCKNMLRKATVQNNQDRKKRESLHLLVILQITFACSVAEEIPAGTFLRGPREEGLGGPQEGSSPGFAAHLYFVRWAHPWVVWKSLLWADCWIVPLGWRKTSTSLDHSLYRRYPLSSLNPLL